ncbi:hypothetical protein [Actinocatenispora comari]|uniref:hypothetical protein n=1 Tax=Actinocatenispora comari TaxID=2807577 RepID=UPI001A92F28F|nr:hypothetical protein [Actinocatenispora comari]
MTVTPAPPADQPSVRLRCDCRCPVHHVRLRTWYDDGCRCALSCATQPPTIVTRYLHGVLFQNPDDLTLSYASWHDDGRVDWASLHEFGMCADNAHIAGVLQAQLAALSACLPDLGDLAPAAPGTAPLARASSPRCDCGCPLHHGCPRRTWNTARCRCALHCTTQPTSFISRAWNRLLFLDTNDSRLLTTIWSSPGRISWGSCIQVTARDDDWSTSAVVQPQMAAIAACLRNIRPDLAY